MIRDIYIKENGINTYAWGDYKINSPSTLSSNLYREYMQDDDDYDMFLNVNILIK